MTGRTGPSIVVPRRRPGTIALVLCILLSGAMWALCALSYFVEWSTFTAGPERPRNPAALLAPGAMTAMTVERDETHCMFGRGLVALHSNTVYTASFQSPNSDLNSWGLAWATVDAMFPGLWRWDWYAPGPVIGIRLWFAAALATVPALVLLALRRRYVPPGHCRGCRYDLRGLTSERCPECGEAASAA